MKKTFYLFILFISILLLCGCYTKVEESFYVDEIEMIEIYVNEKLDFTNISYDYNNCILITNDEGVFATTPGEMLISCDEGSYYVIVKEEQKTMNVTGNNLISVGESSLLNVCIIPETASQSVNFLSTDEDVITVNEEGVVVGVNSGIARVVVSSNNYLDLKSELTFVVIDVDEEYYDPIIENIIVKEDIYVDKDISALRLHSIIEAANLSLVGVSSYQYRFDKISKHDFSSGMIYKMNIHYQDGTIEENVIEYRDVTNIKKFEYFVITTSKYIKDYDAVKVYIGPGHDEIEAEIIQYDTKTSVALIKFESTLFFPVVKIGNSDDIKTGEIILSFGNGTGINHYHTYSLGVISSTKRYLSVDTDYDGVSDWDDEYIQHDALVNSADLGGFIINLKGEVIGLNANKLIGTNYNNMSLSIPINLAMNVVGILETGKAPERPILGIQIFSVNLYQLNKEYYQASYPDAVVPEDLKYGMYVTDVTAGGVADKCGVKVNDILIKFNGILLKESYDIRPQLAKIIVGSGTEVELIVLRNGEEVALKAIF